MKGRRSEECGFYAVGIEGFPISGVTLRNIEFVDCEIPYTLVNAEDVLFKNVRINNSLIPERPQDTGLVKLKTF